MQKTTNNQNQYIKLIIVVVQLLSHVQHFVTPWTAACQASLSSPSPKGMAHSFIELYQPYSPWQGSDSWKGSSWLYNHKFCYSCCSFTKLCPILCDPVNCSAPGLPVLHYLPEDEIGGWHPWLNGHEFQKAPGDSERLGSLACCSPWGRKELDSR